MAWLVTKYFATAAVVVIVSEFARRSGRAGALVACVAITVASFVLFALVVRRFGIELP